MNELLEVISQLDQEQQELLLQKAKEMLAEKSNTLPKTVLKQQESKATFTQKQ